MKKRDLYITDKQDEQLRERAKEKEIRVSELVRNILDKYFEND